MSHTIESFSGRTGVLACLLTAAMAVASAQDVDPKTAAETTKAIAEAKKAEAEAEAAAAKARLGTLADYKTDGTSEVGAGSGKLEAILLATEATRKSAELMADKLVTRIGVAKQDPANPKAVFVIGESEKLNYEAYDSFRVQALAIQRQFEAALATKPGAAPAPEEISAATSATAALTTLGMVANLFRSDYKISSLELTADDMALAKSVMAAAIDKGLTASLHVPGMYSTPLTPESNPAVAQLQELDAIRADATTALTSMSAARDELIARAKQDSKQAAKLRA